MTLDADRINEMISIMDRNRRVINEDIATLVYYMNGGLDYNDAWLLTTDQRKQMSKIIEKHFEATSGNKSGKLIG